MFTKYMHLERIGTAEVEGIEVGITYVFPKLDGTNASVWLGEDGKVHTGSRNRDLTEGSDNAGFREWVRENEEKFLGFLLKFPNYTLYGEWLVPHTLKTYREDAWRKFYIFDVYNRDTEQYLSYDVYQTLLKDAGLDYLAPLAVVKNGTLDTYIKTLDKNVFLIKDGQGVGEGVVIKNYDWVNKYNRVVWAKLINNAFKEDHHKEMGAPILGGSLIEEKIVEKYVIQHLVDNVVAKIELTHDGWHSKCIPQLLNTVFHDLVTEEMWDIIKTLKHPTVSFKVLNNLTISKVKELRSDLF